MLPDAGNMGEIAVVGTRGSKNGILAICKGLVYSTMNQSPSDAKQGLQLALGMVGGKDVPERRNIIPHS
jgi:hypothetical protein